jgi:hypothetical protein
MPLGEAGWRIMAKNAHEAEMEMKRFGGSCESEVYYLLLGGWLLKEFKKNMVEPFLLGLLCCMAWYFA